MNPNNYDVLRKLLRSLAEAEVAAIAHAKLQIVRASSSHSLPPVWKTKCVSSWRGVSKIQQGTKSGVQGTQVRMSSLMIATHPSGLLSHAVAIHVRPLTRN